MPNLGRMAAFAALVAAACIVPTGPVGATSDYSYKPNEYILIEKGTSPDGHWSIRAHTSDAPKDLKFIVYLYREPEGKRLGPLEEVAPLLDTAADAYQALWSPGSGAVGIRYRTDRHFVDTVIYTLAKGRAFPVKGPDVFQTATGIKDSALQESLNSGATLLNWTGPTTFTLHVEQRFRVKDKTLGTRFKGFATAFTDDDDIGDGTFFVQFVADAQCELLLPSGYRIVSVKPGKISD